MTVSYTAEVATCRGFGCFLKLLFRWKGSIYKLVWPDLFFFLGTYFSLSFLYRFFLSPEHQKSFAQIAIYCEKQGALIPLSFVLGFYVSIVVGRWWDQYKTIPWPDAIALFVSASVHGQDDRGRLQRRTIMRYCCLSLTMCFTLISPRVKKRFPTLDHLVDAGLLQESEMKIIDALNRSVPGYSKTWLPIIWASSIVTRARKEGKISNDLALQTILDELNKFRAQCGLLISYDWVSIPLVYTQVVTLAVYSYFLSCVMGRQYLNPDHREHNSYKTSDTTGTGGTLEELDLIFPIFTTLQFFFYMGWLKVAESLVNPFGDDDDDFELNWLVDRNLQVSYLIVDGMHHEHPELVKDQYWDEVLPSELPYTIASEPFREEPPGHSTDKIFISRQNSEIISPEPIKLEDLGECYDGRRSSGTPLRRVRGSFGWRERPSSLRSNASQSTLAESVNEKRSQLGSINSIFRRMFSRDKEKDTPTDSSHKQDGIAGSMTIGPHNLVEDVIFELDENMTTIVSAKSERKPTIQEIFHQSTSSSPRRVSSHSPKVDIPRTSSRLNSPRVSLQHMDAASYAHNSPPLSAPPTFLYPHWPSTKLEEADVNSTSNQLPKDQHNEFPENEKEFSDKKLLTSDESLDDFLVNTRDPLTKGN